VNPLYPTVAERAGDRCEYCRAPEEVFNFSFEVEHIMPRTLGGDISPENTALACESCNLHKSDATEGWDEIEGRSLPLFHPRQDRWHEHFRYDAETGAIVGLTGTGRATVARLKMNSNFQLRARRHWVRLNLYP
jgi:hypothetical protein